MVPTMSLVKSMMAIIKMIKGRERPTLMIQPQHPVEPFVGPNAMGLGDTQENPQGQADEIGKNGGKAHHNQGVTGALQQQGAVLGPESGQGFKHGRLPPLR